MENNINVMLTKYPDEDYNPLCLKKVANLRGKKILYKILPLLSLIVYYY